MRSTFCRQSRDAAETPPTLITVFSSPLHRHRGILACGPLRLPCAIGRSGVTHLKREGDGATPAGRHRLLGLLVRRDRGLPVATTLPVAPIRRDDGWCDMPESGRYNRPVRLPAGESHEDLWRDDRLYDVVGVLDWNLCRRRSRAGSAIFLHAARPGYLPTEGCIALAPQHLRLLLDRIRGPALVLVGPGSRRAR